jgi:allantoinase
VALAAQARARGVDVSIETCPHYLFFTEEDVEWLGALLKCAPPLREAAEQDRLWTELLAGAVNIVASDHSPAPPALKQVEFWRAWGGIAGVQSTLAVLLDRGHFAQGLPLERIAALLAAEPARRFRIPNRGRLAVGCAADCALVDLGARFTLQPEDLLQRHPFSPYTGKSFRGAVRKTLRRGEIIFEEGAITARTQGQFVRPA